MTEHTCPHSILAVMNDVLSDVDIRVREKAQENFCNIFVLGLPRSGTTLVTQVIFENMKIACTNNLMARFWKAPIIGAELSRATLGDTKGTTYRSEFGSTRLPWEPHEFSWFWHHMLNLKLSEEGTLNTLPGDINWAALKDCLCSLNAVFQAALVHKPLELVGERLEQFSACFDKAIYIFIDREDMDIATSIAKARIQHGRGLDEWWSSMPPRPGFQRLVGKPFNIQIAGQVRLLKEMYGRQLSTLSEGNLIKTSYKSLCDRPLDVLEEIQDKSQRLGNKIEIGSVPQPFEYKRTKQDPDIFNALREGFRIVGSWHDHA